MPDGRPTGLCGRGRVLPEAQQAEQALLGAAFANNEVIKRCDWLKPEHFYDPVNGRIWQRAAERVAAGQLADAITLKTDFENTGVLDQIGGTEYLAKLMGAMVGVRTATDYAKVIYQTWVRRQIIATGEQMVADAYGAEPGADPGGIVAATSETIFALGGHGSVNRGVSLATAAQVAFQQTEAAHRGEQGAARLDTGIGPVDELVNGLWPGKLYYIMARSRTGKTPFMMQMARNVAARLQAEAAATGQPPAHVHVFSLEMTAENLAVINLAAVTRWSADQLKAGRIGGAEAWLEYEKKQRELGALPIWIDDEPEMDIAALAMRARAVQQAKRTRLICIDYRELVRRGREQTRMQLPEWIPFLGYQLKALAKSLRVPVIALAQINKAKDKADDTRPTLNDLPYDGGQAADAVFALHRPELYMPEEMPRAAGVKQSDEQRISAMARWDEERARVRGLAEFSALKRRFGPTGMRRLRFDGPRMTFADPDAPPPGLFDDALDGAY